MTTYLISFPGAAMQVPEAELAAVGAAALAVVAEAQDAGVLVFAGGVHEGVAPVLVAADGSTTPGTHPGAAIDGGFTVLDLPSRDEAVAWAGRIAAACRCAQELREFGEGAVS